VPTDYYIDWSERAVHRLRTLTIADRIRVYDEGKHIKPHYETTTCAVLRNPDYYFLKGISSSRVGMYSPLYRLSTPAPFDSGCSNLYFEGVDLEDVLGVMNSLLYRFLFKGFVNHTVNSHLVFAQNRRVSIR
jgi:hypothetical protein